MGHLQTANLHEYDIDYLEALLNDKQDPIHELEDAAYQAGYGPLAPCTFSITQRAQRKDCREYYRIMISFP